MKTHPVCDDERFDPRPEGDPMKRVVLATALAIVGCPLGMAARTGVQSCIGLALVLLSFPLLWWVDRYPDWRDG